MKKLLLPLLVCAGCVTTKPTPEQLCKDMGAGIDKVFAENKCSPEVIGAQNGVSNLSNKPILQAFFPCANKRILVVMFYTAEDEATEKAAIDMGFKPIAGECVEPGKPVTKALTIILTPKKPNLEVKND